MATQKYTYDRLDKKAIEIAKKELNENPAQVAAHIESFRRWFNSMPHLKGPVDDAFLLRFLRTSKFDHSKAQKRLDNFITMRTSPRGVPKWFDFPPLTDPLIDQVLDLKQQVPLGFNGKNEFVVLVRPKVWDPDLIPIEQLARLIYMTTDMITNDERVQIYGVTAIIDMDGVGRKQMEVWGKQENLKNWTKVWQDCYPMRKKDTFFYKEPMLFDVLFKMMEFWQSEKIRKRNIRVKDDFKKIHEKMPGAKAILPKEYGGDAGTLDEVAARWKKQFKEYYGKGYPLSVLSCDESKRPESTMKYMNQYSDYTGEQFGTKGTYVKLDV